MQCSVKVIDEFDGCFHLMTSKTRDILKRVQHEQNAFKRAVGRLLKKEK
ncbi:MAG: hypothetical protein ACLVB3_09475 [Clostridium sp.]